MRVLDDAPLDGGWALTEWPLNHHLTYRSRAGDLEPDYAAIDAWEPPHPLALSDAECAALLECAQRVAPEPSGNGTYFHDCLTPELLELVVRRFTEANRVWWRLDIDQWDAGLKRYDVGERHASHQDLHAGAARRKLAGVVQLSDSSAYEGGALTASWCTEKATMPRPRGTLIAFPGWTVHEVEPVTAGTRWSLCVNGRGPRLR